MPLQAVWVASLEIPLMSWKRLVKPIKEKPSPSWLWSVTCTRNKASPAFIVAYKPILWELVSWMLLRWDVMISVSSMCAKQLDGSAKTCEQAFVRQPWRDFAWHWPCLHLIESVPPWWINPLTRNYIMDLSIVSSRLSKNKDLPHFGGALFPSGHDLHLPLRSSWLPLKPCMVRQDWRVFKKSNGVIEVGLIGWMDGWIR